MCHQAKNRKAKNRKAKNARPKKERGTRLARGKACATGPDEGPNQGPSGYSTSFGSPDVILMSRFWNILITSGRFWCARS